MGSWLVMAFYNLNINMYVCCVFDQGARCGEGLRFRNVSCFVSDGSGQQDGSLVDDELCGDLEPSVEGDSLTVLQEPCTVPCPGKSTIHTSAGREDMTSDTAGEMKFTFMIPSTILTPKHQTSSADSHKHFM